MVDNRISCVTEDKDAGEDGHIVSIGDRVNRWSVAQARQAIDQGHTFHTISESTGKRAEVDKWTCDCGYPMLKSSADAVIDNNLDNLPRCR